MRLERGGRTGRAKVRSRRLALSRNPRLKDASFLSGPNPTAKETPTAELIWDRLPATWVLANYHH
jgi:hypothetical protein